ncbi:DUF3754 domain-containing protein [Aquimarina sp. TRL1]|uniref:DUF3754 domain-containing protein n=1 Tax=Aquimarina sp. (strain TRL1) TaxID=2736252 RepID=UPI001C37C302|nr:DUF3754 domain-containing protein [Aquimarina sp. TRL1]
MSAKNRKRKKVDVYPRYYGIKMTCSTLGIILSVAILFGLTLFLLQEQHPLLYVGSLGAFVVYGISTYVYHTMSIRYLHNLYDRAMHRNSGLIITLSYTQEEWNTFYIQYGAYRRKKHIRNKLLFILLGGALGILLYRDNVPLFFLGVFMGLVIFTPLIIRYQYEKRHYYAPIHYQKRNEVKLTIDGILINTHFIPLSNEHGYISFCKETTFLDQSCLEVFIVKGLGRGKRIIKQYIPLPKRKQLPPESIVELMKERFCNVD